MFWFWGSYVMNVFFKWGWLILVVNVNVCGVNFYSYKFVLVIKIFIYWKCKIIL